MRRDEIVQELKADLQTETLSGRERAIVRYVEKLTLTPSAIGREDVNALRQAGLTDEAVLDVAQLTGYFAFVNRLADGLGVELEDYWEKT